MDLTPFEPASLLARYRVLSPKCGLRVSPLQLGAMSIGESWSSIMGSMNKEQSVKLLDTYYEAGGNFIDTANNYQDEESEKWIDYKSYEIGKNKNPNVCGNHRRSLHMSLRDSLAKLQTDWIDILYLHWWDHTTSIEEIMDGLHTVVQQGKVLYLGISDALAWVVSAANSYATAHGKTPFVVYQGRWNVLLRDFVRDFERDILPMARHFGMALAPWDAIGGGKFQTKKVLEERAKNGERLRSFFGPSQTEDEVKISAALEKVANEYGVESITDVALAYVMSKAPYVFPIVGGRKVEHLKQNIQGVGLKLTKAQIEYLESVKGFDVGFPNNVIGPDPKVTGQPSATISRWSSLDFVQDSRPIGY